ncbi:DUF6428 family protein [Rhodohalobacter sp. 8-1]|uniref:DUF6428 family protein n=1 Tax=Rhodohalobacter sp. 8-1 TaxID=3131972 RepID=UPI0030EBAA55
MKLSEFKKALQTVDGVRFQTPAGSDIPAHFHITEAGLSTKHFVDCGGTIRKESAVSMQLWTAEDYQHRLSAEKLLGILNKVGSLIGDDDLDVEIEYQSDTIGRYGVEFSDTHFQLIPKQTDCLAKETYGIKPSVDTIKAVQMNPALTACSPGSGCC